MKWDIWNSIEYDPQAVEEQAHWAGSALVAAVLWARDIVSEADIRRFLAVDTACLHDPMSMADMAEGVARIQQAIAENETVAVYGDYDADGVTASALLADYLRTKGLECKAYIPDRHEEGYGLNIAALEALQADGVTLVITVDCGIATVKEATIAREMGLDLIITDHHECQGALPTAVAVIDPKRPDCNYPEKELSGVGVAFKLVCAIEGPDKVPEMLTRYSDLVAVGTVADVMDLTGENRVLVAEGLLQLRRGTRPGLRSLIKETGSDRLTMSATGIGFSLAPRLNAAGRMEKAELAFSLLIAQDETESVHLAAELCSLNQQRQAIEREIIAEAFDMLKQNNYTGGPIILASETWHKGVLGIVAARLMEQYCEPVIMLQIENGLVKGSCRSVEGFSLFDALTECQSLLETFGGHQQAAGLTVRTEQLAAFEAAFGAYYAAHPPRSEARTLQADLTVTIPDLITLEQVKSLEHLEPCGKGNPSPLLVIEDAVLQKVVPIGGGKHVKLQIGKWGKVYDGVLFGTEAVSLGVDAGDTVDIVFIPQLNHFRGKTTVQLLIRDIACTNRRQTGYARRLCQDLSEGKSPAAHTAARLTPTREDFVRLWRRLCQEKAELKGQLHQVLDTLVQGRGVSPAKAYLCLQVLDELGLAEVSEQAETLRIQVAQGAEKVDLNASRVLQALQGAITG
ncbi:MAG: single-stranded-DNA-specific exonuclease RecJ [Oscillospiraceae bacterium]|nr:single-stranded-DNA-specific exonuclease RecJ [Oscillospiraceae bacterium]